MQMCMYGAASSYFLPVSPRSNRGFHHRKKRLFPMNNRSQRRSLNGDIPLNISATRFALNHQTEYSIAASLSSRAGIRWVRALPGRTTSDKKTCLLSYTSGNLNSTRKVKRKRRFSKFRSHSCAQCANRTGQSKALAKKT